MKKYLKYIVLMFLVISYQAKPNFVRNNSQDLIDSLAIINSEKIDELTCIDVVFEIVKSNSQCKEMIQNLERLNVRYGYFVLTSPNPERDLAESFSEDYEIVLFESHPEYNHNFAMYRFSLSKKKLYKMDVIEAKYVEVDFDIHLISKLQKKCSN